jgi:hypothetical protein
MPALVAELQSSREHDGPQRSGHDAQLAELRGRTGQPPAGDRYAHAA